MPLIKMIKGWNKKNGGFFRSFHLEVLALQILQDVTITDFPSGTRYFFNKARDVVRQKNLDPAGYGDDIGAYLNTMPKIDDAARRFQSAYESALKAEQYASVGNIRDAVALWSKIFDGYFPAYG